MARRKVTKPRHAMSARQLDRTQLLLRRQAKYLALAAAIARELSGSVARAERR